MNDRRRESPAATPREIASRSALVNARTDEWRTDQWRTDQWRTDQWRTDQWRTDQWRTAGAIPPCVRTTLSIAPTGLTRARPIAVNDSAALTRSDTAALRPPTSLTVNAPSDLR